MKTSELRLGNLVQYGGTTAKVCQIEKSFFYCETDGNDFFTRDGEPGAKPIPLTEEWLLKFGFEKEHNTRDFDYWFKKGFCDDILWEHSEGFCHNLNYGGEIKYVHQLQNLYFAITGEELTFKSE